MSVGKPVIFISYAHKDASQLMTSWSVSIRSSRTVSLETWTDERIQASQDWREEIEQALKKCDAAILLVSKRLLELGFHPQGRAAAAPGATRESRPQPIRDRRPSTWSESSPRSSQSAMGSTRASTIPASLWMD